MRNKQKIAVRGCAGLYIFLGLVAATLLSVSAATSAVATRLPIGPPQEESFNQEQALAVLRKSIAGREEKPAEQVFKNIQVMKGVPAGRLLRIMEMAYNRALGVNCTHCHVAGQWEREDKPAKQATREMITMVRAINNEYLKSNKSLKSTSPVVNCMTCHRGEVKPALDLPAKRDKAER